MEEEKKHNMESPSKDAASSEFPAIDLTFRESKEEVWSKIEAQISSKKSYSGKFLPRSFYVVTVAASILVFVGMFTFFRFYTKTAWCPAGQHLSVVLPDKSEVTLNAETIIAWHPFWMKFDRSVNLEGEAFFNVKKGSGFKVISSKGETRVLGTTFNIYSREDHYRVSCFTGSVHVGSPLTKETALLHPGEQAIMQGNGSIQLIHPTRPEDSKSWMNNMFIFTATPLSSVIQEIERQYNVVINLKEDFPLTYTGNFNKSISEKEVLNLICTSLELKFEAKSNGEYLIYKD